MSIVPRTRGKNFDGSIKLS